MKLELKSIKIIGAFCLLLHLLVSCTGENVDTVKEVSCSEVDGLWTVVSASCDGNVVDSIRPVTYLFDPAQELVTQTTGRVDCATDTQWRFEATAETTLMSLVAEGTLSCTQNSVAVPSCESEINTCFAGVEVSGIKNEFPSCVIIEGEMSWGRRVSLQNNPDNLSYCQDGEEETLTLRQGNYVPPVPVPEPDEELAFLEVQGSNPADIGIYPVGARITQIFTVENIGYADAKNIRGQGLSEPFFFSGFEFPGTDGTCDGILPAGGTCTVEVGFFPQVSGVYTASFTLSYHNGAQVIQIDQGVVGAASQSLAELVISDGPYYNYGDVLVGESLIKNFTIENRGAGEALNLNVAGLDVPYQFSGGSYPGVAGDCGTILLPSQSCQISVEFTPSEIGSFNEVIELHFFDGANDQLVRRNIFGRGQ